MQSARLKWTARWLGILALTVSSALAALEVQGLYEVELVVKSQSAEDRLLAMKQAFYSVLNRVVVSDNIARVPVVQDMLKNPMPYIRQFQYADLAGQNEDGAASLNGPRMLQVEFDEEQILKTLRGAQVALWDENRPATLLWIVIQEEGERQFYHPETLPNFESELNLASRVKGLPFIYPLLDLEEQQKVTVDTLPALDGRTLSELAARYEAISTAVVSFTRRDNCWQSNWMLYFDGRKTEWSGMCQPLRLTLLADAERIYQVLSNFYAARPSTSH